MDWMDRFARAVGGSATMARLGIRSSSFVDTNSVPADWTHITKIDPEDAKRLPLLYPLYLRHTSAVSIGGSQDVTNRNTAETFALLRRAGVPRFHEPSAPHHITKQTWRESRFTAIPEVLNGDSTSLVGELGAAIEAARDDIVPEMFDDAAPWLPRRLHAFLSDFVTSWFLEQAVFEAYIIQNPDSAAAREANVTADDLLTPAEAGRRALAAEKHLESDVVYVEYSGTFGGEEAVAILEAVADAVSWSRVWYGGGLDSAENARAVLDAGADAVIVGDIFHDIADEEATLCAAAVDALDHDADRSAIREWLADAVDVGDTNAARYLSTIPDVRDPAGTARAYLTATVRARLELEAFAAGVDAAAPERAVDGRDPAALPGAEQLRQVLDAEDAADLARAYALARLGGDPDLPVDHVALSAELEPAV